VAFQFFGGTTWKIELLPGKRFMIPFFSEPAGVWRKFGLSHYFKISGKPKPESA